jgi:hypothetical protein
MPEAKKEVKKVYVPKHIKLTFDAGKKLWEQHKDEPDKLYLRFQTFLYLGQNRTVRAAYEQHVDRGEVDLCAWDGTSSRYRWLERASAYDKHVAAEINDKYHKSLKKFQHNLIRSLELASQDFVEALESKDLEKLKRLAPVHMSLIGKGNTGNFLLAGHKQVFGEKQQVQQSITVEWDPIEPEPRTINITPAQIEPKKALSNQHEQDINGKTSGASGFIELED